MQIQRTGDGAVFESPEGEVPEGFTRIDTPSSTVSPGSLTGMLDSALRPVYNAMQQVGQGYRENVAQPATEGVLRGLQTLPFDQGPGSQMALPAIARTIVPQTATGAGMVAGSLMSGGLPLLPRLMGATAGGFIGGGLEGQPNMGAAEGLAGGLTAEALAYLPSAARRYFGQQAADEAAVGGAVGSISPTLGTQTTAPAMQDRFKGLSGQQDLQAAYRGARQSVEQGVANAPGAGPVQPGFPAPLSSNAITVPAGGALDQLTGKTAMTFDEAARAIEALRAGRHPLTGALTGSTKGATEKQLKTQAVGELLDSLRQIDPALADVFGTAERDYGTGMELLRLFRTKGVLDPKTGGLNMPALQQLVGEKQAVLERMLPPDGWTALREAVYRGASPPAMDLPGYQLPFIRTYPGSGNVSVGEALPLTPTRYIGENRLRVPTMFFMPPSAALVDSRNPYQRSR